MQHIDSCAQAIVQAATKDVHVVSRHFMRNDVESRMREMRLLMEPFRHAVNNQQELERIHQILAEVEARVDEHLERSTGNDKAIQLCQYTLNGIRALM